MADLENHAFKRDRGFLFRLTLALGAGTLFGLVVWGQLTSDRTSNCAVNLLMNSTGDEAPPARPSPAQSQTP